VSTRRPFRRRTNGHERFTTTGELVGAREVSSEDAPSGDRVEAQTSDTHQREGILVLEPSPAALSWRVRVAPPRRDLQSARAHLVATARIEVLHEGHGAGMAAGLEACAERFERWAGVHPRGGIEAGVHAHVVRDTHFQLETIVVLRAADD
jgi:hypothetical protein